MRALSKDIGVRVRWSCSEEEGGRGDLDRLAEKGQSRDQEKETSVRN